MLTGAWRARSQLSGRRRTPLSTRDMKSVGGAAISTVGSGTGVREVADDDSYTGGSARRDTFSLNCESVPSLTAYDTSVDGPNRRISASSMPRLRTWRTASSASR